MPICLECSLVQQIIQLAYYNLLASMASKNLCANQESNVQLYHIWLSTMMSNWTTYNVCEYFSCWKENVDPWQRPMVMPTCPKKRLCQHEMKLLKYFILLSWHFLIWCYCLLTITLHVHLTKNGVVTFKWQSRYFWTY